MIEEGEKHWLVRERTVRLLWRCSLVALVLLVLSDVLVHGHPVFGIEGTFGFHAWFGLLTCAAMVLVSKALGVVLKRPDSYYRDE